MANMGGFGVSSDARAIMAFQAKRKSPGVSYALWIFLGGLGAHRFYHGRVISGFGLMALSLFGYFALLGGGIPYFVMAGGVWMIVDAFLIPGWVAAYNARLIDELASASLPRRGRPAI